MEQFFRVIRTGDFPTAMNPVKKCVLLVEDSPADARLMVELLSDAGAGEVKVQHADIAMFYAKRACNQVCFYRDCKDDL